MAKNKTTPHYAGEEIKKQTKYIDMYPGITDEAYRRFFKHVADIGSVEGAQKSVERIKQLYTYFETIGDRAGQHNAVVIALSAYHRAYFAGKRNIAAVYRSVIAHLTMANRNTLQSVGIIAGKNVSPMSDERLIAAINKAKENSIEHGGAGAIIGLTPFDPLTATAMLITGIREGFLPVDIAGRLLYEIGRRAGESNFYNETE